MKCSVEDKQGLNFNSNVSLECGKWPLLLGIVSVSTDKVYRGDWIIELLGEFVFSLNKYNFITSNKSQFIKKNNI